MTRLEKLIRNAERRNARDKLAQADARRRLIQWQAPTAETPHERG